MSDEHIKIIVNNSKAKFNYFLDDFTECGIELKGSEIKSIRNGLANLKDCYAIVKNGEVFLLNMYIGKYEEANIFNHEERRTRKLLLHKKEINKLKEGSEQDGYSIIPLKIYLNSIPSSVSKYISMEGIFTSLYVFL